MLKIYAYGTKQKFLDLENNKCVKDPKKEGQNGGFCKDLFWTSEAIDTGN